MEFIDNYKIKNIGIIGAGYVGLTAAAGLAEIGHNVICGDIDKEKINNLNNGYVPITEPGIDELISNGLALGKLVFCVGTEEVVRKSDVIFLCLPTPQNNDGSADTSFIESVVKDIASTLKPGSIIVNKSTAPIGTVEKICNILGRKDIAVVCNPEFLREGAAVYDFFNPDRIVIGSNNYEAAKIIADIYSSIKCPVILTSTESAEMIKYISNAFLAIKISFANSIATLCELVNANIFDVISGVGLDSRIGGSFLQPGPGWGGSCFPKDSTAIINIAEKYGYNFSILKAAVDTNNKQKKHIVEKIQKAFNNKNLDGKKIAVLGLTFKANTNDLRNSPSISIIRSLIELGADIKAYDPTTIDTNLNLQKKELKDISIAKSVSEALDGSDAVLLLTEWPEFSNLDLIEAAKLLSNLIIIDARNLINQKDAVDAGFYYDGVGIPMIYSEKR